MLLPFPSEEFVEDYIFESIKNNNKCPVSKIHVDACYRRLNLGECGAADIVKITSTTHEIGITVLELKNEPLSGKHLTQLFRYMKGVIDLTDRYQDRLKIPINVYGELAGPIYTRNNIVFSVPFLKDNVNIFKLSFCLDEGFKSEKLSPYWTKNIIKNTKIKEVVRSGFDAYKAKKDMALYLEEKSKNG